MPLDINTIESWLWEAACVIRGPVDAPKFKDYILPLIFLKRLSDVFEDEIRVLEEDFGSQQKALKLADADHKLVRFFVPDNARWPKIAARTTGLGEYLTEQEIAARLAAVDAKLAAGEARRAALVALSQSLLHHLMTGRIRLPEFRSQGERGTELGSGAG